MTSSTLASLPLHTLTDFIKAFAHYSATTPGLKCYRGQRDVSWPSLPGLFRPDYAPLEANEKRAVRDLISVHPNEFDPDESMFDKLVRMQHYGLPTRLMDVSLNALAALYFAADPGEDGKRSNGVVMAFAVPEQREKYFDSDCVSCLANLSNLTKDEKNEIYTLRATRKRGIMTRAKAIEDFNSTDVIKRLHQFIRVEKPYFLPIINPIDLFKPYFVHPKLSNRRILAQSGAFIIHGITPPKSIKYAHPIAETPFVVSEGDKVAIRASLADIGISESTLFPELDKAAKRIKEHYAA